MKPILRKADTASGTSHAVKVRGIAHLPGEADMSMAKVTIAPTPAGRYAVPADFRGAFSAAGVGRDVETGRAW